MAEAEATICSDLHGRFGALSIMDAIIFVSLCFVLGYCLGDLLASDD
jgi:hypothetical protein